MPFLKFPAFPQCLKIKIPYLRAYVAESNSSTRQAFRIIAFIRNKRASHLVILFGNLKVHEFNSHSLSSLNLEKNSYSIGKN